MTNRYIQSLEDVICRTESERDKYRDENLRLIQEVSALQAKLLLIKKEVETLNKLLE